MAARLAVFAVLLWLAGLILGIWAWTHSFVQSERQRLHDEFEQAFATLAHRLDENEVILHGLMALLRASRDPAFPGLRSYANDMLERYPYLYTVGYQPRVLQDQRASFEQRMSQRLGRPFHIRDFHFDGDRRWRPSPEYPVYYPVTFMAPELPDARDVIGYNVYDDARFRQAIQHSAQEGHAVPTLPFDFAEGGRGYIFLQALNLSASDETTAHVPQHLISLLIRADRLFTGIEPSTGTVLTLRHTQETGDASRIWSTPPTRVDPSAISAWSETGIHLQRAFASSQQPFALTLEATPQWARFPRATTAVAGTVWTLLVFGTLAGWLTLQRSRRQRREAQAELARNAQRAEATRLHSLNELGSGIAHELNQPLSAILSYSQAALHILDLPESAPERLPLLRETLQASAAQAMRAGELMQRLRALIHKRALSLQPLVAQAWVRSACRSTAVQEAGPVELDLHLPEAPIHLQGDPLLLEQLLLNLLRNAAEAMQAQPVDTRRIAVELTQHDDQCSLRVMDNGPGFNDEQRGRAFHPFQSTKQAGLGIGLALSATIVTAHQGSIEVEAHVPTTYPDLHGASLRVRLPAEKP